MQYSTGPLRLEVQTHKAQRLQLQEGALACPGSRNGAAREVEVCQGNVVQQGQVIGPALWQKALSSCTASVQSACKPVIVRSGTVLRM